MNIPQERVTIGSDLARMVSELYVIRVNNYKMFMATNNGNCCVKCGGKEDDNYLIL